MEDSAAPVIKKPGELLKLRLCRYVGKLTICILQLSLFLGGVGDKANAFTRQTNYSSTDPRLESYFSPPSLLEQTLEISGLTDSVIDLLDYVASNTDPESRDSLITHIEHYNRKLHFGGWINQDANDSTGCHSTRNEVLNRDSISNAAIVFKPSSCTIISGHWIDPYTSANYLQARDIQIDHVVPLKNAYLSGAHNWTPARRCHYANYLKNNFHLLSVSGHENMKKSDRGPENYMPPDTTYQCLYLREWMSIKAIWSLSVTPYERDSIQRLFSEQRCSRSLSQITSTEFNDQIGKSQLPPRTCLDRN
jgi:hypothetical protein